MARASCDTQTADKWPTLIWPQKMFVNAYTRFINSLVGYYSDDFPTGPTIHLSNVNHFEKCDRSRKLAGFYSHENTASFNIVIKIESEVHLKISSNAYTKRGELINLHARV